MPFTPTYPGIYIQELPATAHTITAAPTSITVFVGYTHPFKTPAANSGVPVEIFSFTDYEREFGGFYQSGVIDGNVARAVNDFFLNGGSHAYVVSTTPFDSSGVLSLEYSPTDGSNQIAFANLGTVTPASQDFSNGITFTSLEPTDTTQLGMTIAISNLQSTTTNHDTADITISYGSRSETFRKVVTSSSDPTTNKDPNFLNNRIIGVSTLVTVSPTKGSPTFPNYPLNFSAAEKHTLTTALPTTIKGVFNNTNFDPAFATDGALDKLPVFNLIVIPGIVNNSVLSEALAFCERKLAFFIMDPPKVDKADSADKDYIGNFVDQSRTGDSETNLAPLSQNGALYFPFLNTLDPLSGATIQSPPSGYVAGIYARTDLNRGVWKAPAGLETTILDTSGVVETGRMTDPRHGALNIIGVNCLRSFPTGTVVFGARTLVGADDNTAFQQWKYVPVRRMALFIEQTLYANLKWVIFEPNDDPLWTAIRTTINNFMLSLFNQGAFQGSKPSDAFQVKCDSRTTTQDDINNGIVNIIVAFAPLKPAEFVIIKIAQLAGQVQQ